MTDLEKAKEIQKNDVCLCWNGGCPNVRDGAMKMAAWKQEQMIEKAVRWLNEVVKDEQSNYVWYDAEEGFCGITHEFIEDLKKVMEE